jgi:hypothetical protein
MQDFWMIPTANIRLQIYTSMMVGEPRIHTLEVVVVVWCFVPQVHVPYLDKWFVEIYLNVN